MTANWAKLKQQSLINISGLLTYDSSSTLQLLRSGQGSKPGCAMMMESTYRYKALQAMFLQQDPALFRQYTYTSALFRIMKAQQQPAQFDGMCALFAAVVCDDAELYHWHSQHVLPSFSTIPKQKWIDRNRVGSREFQTFQLHLAMQQKFELLAERAEYILAHPPGKNMLKYQVDNQFFLGLARGDVALMTEALTLLCSPKFAARRFHADGIICNYLLSPFGLMYGKMAWRAGYQLDIDSPLYPTELVAVAPLPQYQRSYDVLETLDIYQPFAYDQHFTPLPPGQFNLDICQQSRPMEKLP